MQAHRRTQRGRIATPPIGLGFPHDLLPAGVRGVAEVTKPGGENENNYLKNGYLQKNEPGRGSANSLLIPRRCARQTRAFLLESFACAQ